MSEKFIEYDPATGITTSLGNPPEFAPSGCSNKGFEPWGGLQFDGSKIYGHQGDGCTGFGVYDFASNGWSELPLAPEVEEEEGPVLGSALDPITNTYLTYGPYQGKTFYRYDIEGGSWSTTPAPFTEIGDGGMAYVGLPGIEGVYVIEGEDGTAFLRYTERNQTDLSTSMSASVAGTATGGEITYSIQVKNNGPERASGVVLSDSLPAGTKSVSASSGLGACAGTTTVSCALGVLRSGESTGLTIKVTAGFGMVSNTATVSSQAIDSNPANDSATVVSAVAGCVVPKLRGLRLKGAKKALRAAHCKPGKVTRRYSRKVKRGRVVRAGGHRGTVLPVAARSSCRSPAAPSTRVTTNRTELTRQNERPKCPFPDPLAFGTLPGEWVEGQSRPAPSVSARLGRPEMPSFS